MTLISETESYKYHHKLKYYPLQWGVTALPAPPAANRSLCKTEESITTHGIHQHAQSVLRREIHPTEKLRQPLSLDWPDGVGQGPHLL